MSYVIINVVFYIRRQELNYDLIVATFRSEGALPETPASHTWTARLQRTLLSLFLFCHVHSTL